MGGSSARLLVLSPPRGSNLWGMPITGYLSASVKGCDAMTDRESYLSLVTLASKVACYGVRGWVKIVFDPCVFRGLRQCPDLVSEELALQSSKV